MCGGERTRANNVSDKKGFNMVLTDVSLFIPPVDRARCFFELGALCWLGALELGASNRVLLLIKLPRDISTKPKSVAE